MSLPRRLRSGAGTVDSGAWLVVGLGNPGSQYAETRHNVGYRVAELLVVRIGSSFRAHKSRRADVVEGWLGRPGSDGVRVVIARPRSYMNDSGGPVRALTDFYRTPANRLVVVHDDLDLPVGTLRIKFGGGNGGHNGLRSIRAALGTGDFFRVRVGIGRPVDAVGPAEYVLRAPPVAERAALGAQLEKAAGAVEHLLLNGLSITQDTFH